MFHILQTAEGLYVRCKGLFTNLCYSLPLRLCALLFPLYISDFDLF
jgi:hypothetical protein